MMLKCWFVGWDKVDVYSYHVDAVDAVDGVCVFVVLFAVFCVRSRESACCLLGKFLLGVFVRCPHIWFRQLPISVEICA